MPSVSLCMIVKNEEAVLARCLDSMAIIMDEIIILDTGSTDNTKEIASRYTKKVYDFEWTGSFADARNASFALATKDYIYCADADEVLDEDNKKKLFMLKRALLPEVEIVQMYYETITDEPQLYNFKKEYRPKLFKRLRTFTWINEIHETVRLDPVVFDSDITVTHMPRGNHAERDIQSFEQLTKDGEILSAKQHHMYAMELYRLGTEEQLINSIPYFERVQKCTGKITSSPDYETMVKEAACVLAKAYRLKNDVSAFFTQCIRETAGNESCSEICYELGKYYSDNGKYMDAVMWYHNAAYETESIIDVCAGGGDALMRLAECYGKVGRLQDAARVRKQANAWELPYSH